MTKSDRDPVNVERGARLRQVRERLQMTQEEMAKELSMAVTTYSNWETGYGRISIPGYEKIRDRWGVSTDYILYGDLPLVPLQKKRAG